MIKKDDRTDEQRRTHTRGVVGRDTFMSGWGLAEGGYSRACWAFDPATTSGNEVYRRIKERSDMRYVTLVDLRTYRPPSGTAHFHIYVWDRAERIQKALDGEVAS